MEPQEHHKARRSKPGEGAAATRAPILITPADVASTYGIPESTQAVWRCANRHGFGRLVVKLGRSVRYDRGDFESWIASKRAYNPEAA